MDLVNWLATHRYNYLDLITCTAATTLWIGTEWFWGVLAIFVGAAISVWAERSVGIR